MQNNVIIIQQIIRFRIESFNFLSHSIDFKLFKPIIDFQKSTAYTYQRQMFKTWTDIDNMKKDIFFWVEEYHCLTG